MDKIKADLVIKNASQILNINPTFGDVGLVHDGYIAINGDKISFVGSEDEFYKKVDLQNVKSIDATGKVVLPGFVDCHTHLVFGESRIDEYIGNLTKEGKEKLKNRGLKTGIYASVDMTRDADEETLYNESLHRVKNMNKFGTTTIEIKSGYGLDIETEMKQLRVIDRLKKESGLTIISTYLGAHGWPQDATKEDYIEKIIDEILPIISESKLADACDIWVDSGYYDVKEARRILTRARKLGMDLKMHTDCYSYVGGTDLTAEMKMFSGDHLNFIPKEAMVKMAAENIVGVLLPGTDFSVNHPKQFDPRPMIDSGMELAIATNLNPGNWIESMQLIIALACRRHGMTPKEALWASTLGGAKALGIGNERGSLNKGYYADIQIWDTSDYRDVAYKPGNNLIDKVVKDGRIIYQQCKKDFEK